MPYRPVEVEFAVECVRYREHPVRVRMHSWRRWEVAYNPCEALLGRAFALMTPCAELLRRRPAEVRRAAAAALGKAGARAVRILRGALRDAARQVREAACESLGRIGHPSAISALARVLKRDSHRDYLGQYALRVAASKALAQIGAASLPALRDAAATGNLFTRLLALQTAVQLGDAESLETLVAMLHSGDTPTRLAVCAALGRTRYPAAAEPLLQVLQDSSQARLHAEAAQALGRLRAREAVPVLLEALEDEQAALRAAACEALGAIGDPAARPALEIRLTDTAPMVRRAACEALRELRHPESAHAVMQLLTEDNEWNRQTACHVLGLLGNRVAAPALIERLGDASALVRATACRALMHLHVTSAVEAIAPLLQDPDGWVRSSACEALAKLGGKTVAEQLEPLTQDRDKKVRIAAWAALGELGDPRAQPALETLMEDDDADVRRNARWALRWMRR